MFIVEATNTNFIVGTGAKPPIYRPHGEHTNHYTTEIFAFVA